MNETSGRVADAASRLGFGTGNIVGEIGYDADVDEDLRQGIETTIGSELLGGDDDEVFDALLVWWRADEGDLTDELVDAMTPLAEGGMVYLATPRAGRDGYVDAGDIDEAASTAGFGQTMSLPPSGGWMITKLLPSRPSGKPRK